MFKKKDEKLRELEKIPLLKDFASDELRTISKHAELVTYEPGSTLIEEGSLSSEFFIIVEGSVLVEKDGDTVATLEDGNVVGESALLDWWAPPRDHRSEYSTGRRTATVTAASDSQVRTLVFEPRGFEALREEVPRVALRLMNEMSRRFRGDEPE